MQLVIHPQSCYLMQLIVKLETVSIAHLLITVTANLKTMSVKWVSITWQDIYFNKNDMTWLEINLDDKNSVKVLAVEIESDRSTKLDMLTFVWLQLTTINHWAFVWSGFEWLCLAKYLSRPRRKMNLFVQNAKNTHHHQSTWLVIVDYTKSECKIETKKS